MREIRTELVELAKITVRDGFFVRQAKVLQNSHIHNWFPTPIVDEANRLILGEACVARYAYRNVSVVMCRVVECSEELASVAHDMDDALGAKAEVVRFVTALANYVEATGYDRKPTGGKRGRSREPLTEACSRASRWLNTSTESLRILVNRSKRAEAGNKPEPKSKKDEWRLQCYGFEPADGLELRAMAVRHNLIVADHALRRAVAELKAAGQIVPILSTRVPRTEEISRAAREHAPHALCPWCKSVSRVIDQCTACYGSGFVSRGAFSRAPSELINNYWVAVSGEFLDAKTLRPPSLMSPRSEAYFGDHESYTEEEEPSL